MNLRVLLTSKIHFAKQLAHLYHDLPFHLRDPFLLATSHFAELLSEHHHEEQLNCVRNAMGIQDSSGSWATLMTMPLTVEEKRKLSIAISNLPRSKLNRVIEILERRQGRYCTGTGSSSKCSLFCGASRVFEPAQLLSRVAIAGHRGSQLEGGLWCWEAQ